MLVLAQGSGFDWGFLYNTGNLAVFMGIGCGMIFIIASAVVKIIRVREEAALKARLIERGASAEEIERILNAGSIEDSDAC
ncbi:hypothetical protein [Mucisphaera calidilacus]|uniref:Uncharacterized protein n=1 Tax=Mucisphaera calidilacus TaxID=2527982 RepID=A0A518BZS4_9BACT|nr:hypothetical protein [Mucisphaera calidilacus]QDU72477.1 hypothetical protein Pan265_23430 [Mucisphaera calidilacus]